MVEFKVQGFFSVGSGRVQGFVQFSGMLLQAPTASCSSSVRTSTPPLSRPPTTSRKTQRDANMQTMTSLPKAAHDHMMHMARGLPQLP